VANFLHSLSRVEFCYSAHNSESNTLSVGVGQGNQLAHEMAGTWFGQQEYIYSLFLRCVLWRCLQRRSVTEHELGYVSNVTHKLSSSYVRAVRLYFVGNELLLCGFLSMHLFISCSRGKWYSISHSPCTETHFAQFTPVSPSHETFIRSIHSLCALSCRTLEPTDFSLNSIRSVIFLKVSSPQYFLSPCFRRYQPSVRKNSSENYCRSTKSVYHSILHFV